MTPRELLNTIVREHDAGRCVALCAVVATHGSTPQPPGAMILVDEAAGLHGTLGGGCVEADVRRLAHQRMKSGPGQIVTFQLDDDFGFDDGMICGGRMEIAICPITASDDITPFREAAAAMDRRTAAPDRQAAAPDRQPARIPLWVRQGETVLEYRILMEPAPRLLIAGAGHIGRRLAGLARDIGFDVHVIDDRRECAHEQRFPQPIHLHVGPIAETLKALAGEPGSYIVIVTRGHRHDEAALRSILDAPAKYIGMIGSRRKIEVIFNDLRHDGVGEDRLDRVHAPIGLAIGAMTAEEIAVSIAAELIKVRRATSRHIVEGPEQIGTM